MNVYFTKEQVRMIQWAIGSRRTKEVEAAGFDPMDVGAVYEFLDFLYNYGDDDESVEL